MFRYRSGRLMKKHRLAVGLAMAGVGFTFIVNGQESKHPAAPKSQRPQQSDQVDPFDPDYVAPKPIQIRVQVEFLEMSHETLTKLLFNAKPSTSDATELRQQVQDLVSKNEAKVLETLIAVSQQGSKATTESLHEFMYPTEFTPTAVNERIYRIQDVQKTAAESGLCFNPSTPTAFETRNVGSTFEIEPRFDTESQTIDLRFIPEIVWHTGNTVWHEGKVSNGNPFKMPLPDFYSVRLNTAISCINGQYTLAGTISPKDDKGDTDMTRKVMVFVKCDVLEVK